MKSASLKSALHIIVSPQDEVELEAKIVAAEAFANLVTTLEGYSNDLAPDHMDALWHLLHDMSKMAHGLLTGRRAYPLSCGLGKTQSVIALCATLYARKSDRSVAISASKVEALAEIKRHLVERHGVSEEAIGFVHSYKYDKAKRDEARRGEAPGYASEPATENNELQHRQFLLVTHSRMRGGKPLEKFYPYKGCNRNLLVWDESLISSDCQVLDHRAVQSALGGAAPWMPATSEALRYLRSAVDLLDVELRRQMSEAAKGTTGVKPQPVVLPSLDGLKIAEFKAELPCNKGINVAPLKHLLEMSVSPLRVLLTNQDYGVVTYDIVIPEELKSVAILDASYPIRLLENEDKSIEIGFEPNRNIKLYNNVTVRHVSTGSGRERMAKDFTDKRLMCAEVVSVVRTIPQDEAVTLWAFKEGTGKVNFVSILKAAMKDAGIDTDAKVENGKDRFVFRTFGQETSDSDYAYSTNSIFTGVMFRAHFDLAACYIGQRDDQWLEVEQRKIHLLVNSEATHSVFQAICRGSCRRIEGNQAKPHKVWLPVRGKAILRSLAQVMPGVKIEPWETQFIAAGKLSKMVAHIGDYLDGLAPTAKPISMMSIKRGMGLKPEEMKLFTRALTEFLEENAVEYERDESGRSLVMAFPELRTDVTAD